MLFSELLSLSFDPNTDRIDMEAILAAVPNTPDDVARQFFSDHGRKDEFQAAYGHVNLASLQWPCRLPGIRDLRGFRAPALSALV